MADGAKAIVTHIGKALMQVRELQIMLMIVYYVNTLNLDILSSSHMDTCSIYTSIERDRCALYHWKVITQSLSHVCLRW